jgi:hypothetical protein
MFALLCEVAGDPRVLSEYNGQQWGQKQFKLRVNRILIQRAKPNSHLLTHHSGVPSEQNNPVTQQPKAYGHECTSRSMCNENSRRYDSLAVN